MESTGKTISELMARPYRKIVTGTPDDGYVAEAPELDRCIGMGETEVEALEGLHQAMEAWFEGALAEGRSIPEPSADVSKFSGNLRLRLPRTVHAEAARRADQEGVSLNTFLLSAISAKVGSVEKSPSQLGRDAYFFATMKLLGAHWNGGQINNIVDILGALDMPNDVFARIGEGDRQTLLALRERLKALVGELLTDAELDLWLPLSTSAVQRV